MSQPEDFGPSGHDPLALRLTNFDQLLEIFYAAQKTSAESMMGIEYEMFAHDVRHQRPLSYEGDISISSFFSYLAQKTATHSDPFVPIIESDHIVALNSKRATIALEPGGQIEIAAKPQKNLKAVNQIFLDVAKELEQAAQELGILLFAVGIHPLAKREDMAQVKKSRYEIMRSYMGHLPGLGLDMMTRSCSIQLNLDFENEQDMVKKMRLAARLMPFFSLLCSSAVFIEGQPSPYALPRGHIWQETDPARTGFPSIIFEPNFGYRAWIEWALDVPMYFIRRGTTYINVAGASFRDFVAHGLKGETALVRDFVDHLSTIFTEVRLKPFIEIRSPDSLPVSYVTALAALTWALFYGENSCKASSLLESLDHQNLVKLHSDVIKHGTKAQWHGQPVLAIAALLIKSAKIDLEKSNLAHYVEPFEILVNNNTVVSEIIKRDFNTIKNDNLLSLIKKLLIFNQTVI